MKPVVSSVAIAAMSFLLLGPSSVAAQSLCGPREAVITMLDDRYGETLRSMGLAGGTRIVEVFASDETGSWTILVTNAAGVACLVASGQHYEELGPAPAGAPL